MKAQVEIKPYNISELARHYSINRKTMSKWIKFLEGGLGRKAGHKFSLVQVQIIFQNFGTPLKSSTKEEKNVDMEKLEESIDNLQDQLRMLEKSKAKIAERLIMLQGLYYSLTHKLE